MSSRPLSPEHCDERFSGYLLSLAASSTEKQLKEQALAAFPNEQVYQPVAHFAIDKEDADSEGEDSAFFDTSNELSLRRQSSADLSWELECMRQHKEEAEMRDRAMIGRQKPAYTPAEAMKGQAFGRLQSFPPTNTLEAWQRDPNITLMRHGASPPMLGDDLVFPQSLSPRSTLCDAEHGHASTYQQGTQEETCEHCGLWCASAHVHNDCGGGGLWKGTCLKAGELGYHPRESVLSGIITPIPPVDDVIVDLDIPLTTPTIQNGKRPSTCTLEDGLCKEGDNTDFLTKGEINEEFNDTFVTQIYNYLSLGYPSVARYYDHELSKISGISIDALRRDDLSSVAQGHVGIGERIFLDKETPGGRCVRWVALQLYIHEWARQQPRMVNADSSLETWGVRERRGSWAI
ncbi:hypothetical protein ASPZODRAFT_159850 [Penicilliopsis zonata CBS 506.65]|uniref:Uncharacterized protein n=1 Tax=Penicilliopsis zonata CBS 506.65 TaxID=1073090 RepID=A0A1L9SGR7_9EURO|nr:hypothetical protein ASPZODRAFT_159850 [Penicilliopsis zonata CBS 506.65]OJJ46328.1 hypothetical protein ASPZODRAFT_159850 [Penicilliopsis zonata CBS 506.65]